MNAAINNMTIAQLKRELTSKGIKFAPKMKKDDIVNLLVVFVDIARLANPVLVVIDNDPLANAIQCGSLRIFPVVRFAWEAIWDPQLELGSHLFGNLLVEGEYDDLQAQRNLVGALRDQCRLP